MTTKRDCGSCDVCMRALPNPERVACGWSTGVLPAHLKPDVVHACMHGLTTASGLNWLIVHQLAGTRTTKAMRDIVESMSMRSTVVVIRAERCFVWSRGEIVRRFDKIDLQQEVSNV